MTPPDNPLPSHAMPIPIDARRQARSLYWRGWGITQIADELDLKRSTVQAWKDREKWDEAPSLSKIEDALECRLNSLIAKESKTGGDFKEIDLLMRQVVATARVRRYEAPGGHAGDLNEKVGNRNAGERKKAAKNHFTEEQVEQLEAIFEAELFGYQEDWWAAKDNRTRMILKSRQIGATWYFAREALIDALRGGGNQIFLSASKNQAHIFRGYIIQFAARVGVKLQGDPIVITADTMPEGEPAAELIFLGTNARTAQGYHGNFYFDEFFWTYGFEELNKVASGMAMHKRWRRTYFSTPSSVAHQAHPYWTGERRNRRVKKEDRVTIDVSHARLQAGVLCEDQVWRQIVTIEDAGARGCDLFDIDELRVEYAPDEFANLLMCQFVDDSLSAFKFNELQRATVDAIVDWRDVDLLANRPVGNHPVWAGYDPQESEDGDNAALVIALPPEGPGGKFRLLERWPLRGLDFEAQAEFVVARLKRYNCTYLGVDATGVGAAVYQLLRDRMRGVVKIEYSLETKAAMVMKAQHSFARGRIEFDAGWIDVQSSFLSIKKALTGSGRAITFKASRSEETGHADLAWAVMHILINEPLDGKARPKTRMEIIDGEAEDPADVAGGDGGGFSWGDRSDKFVGIERGEIGRDGVQLRRSGAGAQPTRDHGHAGVRPQWPLVRASHSRRWAGPCVSRVAAPQLRHLPQAQSAGRRVPAIAAV
ncbi:terminase large subunit domain-containing protein [Sphingomonas sp. LT1P40]|uniref:terminase large subunit domain-containing protein n=1 Tax=Alteristakelama amylovorans TaxID=3096166 RepID=UPI003FA79265